MNTITCYYNIPFRCENIKKELYKFWISKAIEHRNSKIWLTVNVNVNNNITFTLIDNLPFNTLDYNDGLTVLENNFKSNLVLSKADMLNNITISYNIINKVTDYNHYYTKFNICFFGFLFLIIIAFYYYTIYNKSISIVYIPIETINEAPIEYSNYKPNKCVFGLFSEVFKPTNSHYVYYPSYFAKYEIIYDNDYNYYNNSYLPNHVTEYINNTEKLVHDLITIATEYSSVINDLYA